MDDREWEKIYNKIIEDFNFDKEKDVEAAKILSSFFKEKPDVKILEKMIKGKEVFIFGAGPSLKRHVKILKNIKKCQPIIVADGACKAFLEEGIIPDIIVSDLDGDIESLIECNKKGAIVVLHAHGDNIDKIKKYFHKLKNVIPTTQIPEYKKYKLYNFYGFTDGDRCCYLAYYFKAKKLILGGMDFGEYVTKYSRPEIKGEIEKADNIKAKKLRYAEYLINLLKDKIEIVFLP